MRDAHQQLVEAGGPDFPGEIGQRAFMRVKIVHPGGGFAFARRNRRNQLAAIVIDPEKIERRAALLQISGLHSHHLQWIRSGKGRGVIAPQGRLNEPHIAERVRAVRSLAVLLQSRRRLAVRHTERRADL